MFFRSTITTDARSRRIGILFILAAVLIWSTVPVGTRLLMHDRGADVGGAFSPAFISAARLCVAAGVFLFIRSITCRQSGCAFWVPVRQKGWLLIAAGSVCFNYLIYAIGLRFTTAGVTSVVSQVSSVATVLLAAWLLGERLTRQKIVGMAAALTGVFLVVFSGVSLQALLSSTHFLGNLIELIAALAWPFYAIGQTKLLQGNGDRQVLMPIFVTAAVFSIALLPFTGPLIQHAPTVLDWAVLFFLGAGSTAAAYWLFAAGVQRIETSEGAMFNVLIPLIALLMAHWVLHETLHSSVIIGLLFVVVGLVLIVWRRHHSPLRRSSARMIRKRVLTHPAEV